MIYLGMANLCFNLRLKIIKKGLSRERGVRVFHDLPKYAHMQGVFSLGDRRIAELVEEMVSSSGLSSGKAPSRVNRDFYIFRSKEVDEVLPWDFIDAGVPKEHLWEEYRKALHAEV